MLRNPVIWLTFSVLAAAAVWAGGVTASDDDAWHEDGSAYEMAREALERGDALPLTEVRRHLSEIAPGKIVSTHYEHEFERWVYEFKIVDPQGRLQKVHLDAHTGELVMKSDY